MQLVKRVGVMCAAMVAAMFASVPAFAAPQAAVDVSDLVTGIGNQATPLTTLALAFVALVILVKTLHLFKRA